MLAHLAIAASLLAATFCGQGRSRPVSLLIAMPGFAELQEDLKGSEDSLNYALRRANSNLVEFSELPRARQRRALRSLLRLSLRFAFAHPKADETPGSGILAPPRRYGSFSDVGELGGMDRQVFARCMRLVNAGYFDLPRLKKNMGTQSFRVGHNRTPGAR